MPAGCGSGATVCDRGITNATEPVGMVSFSSCDMTQIDTGREIAQKGGKAEYF
jgi:hypothetical protein